jgi:hypothetical protein
MPEAINPLEHTPLMANCFFQHNMSLEQVRPNLPGKGTQPPLRVSYRSARVNTRVLLPAQVTGQLCNAYIIHKCDLGPQMTRARAAGFTPQV